MENLYYEVALPLPLRNSFTYSSNIKISNGSRVQVPFRNREIVGYVLKKQSSPNVKSIKPITKVIDRNTGEIYIGRVPAYSVVVPGSLPGKPISDGSQGPSLYCAVIVKKVDAQTRSKTSVNELLRD